MLKILEKKEPTTQSIRYLFESEYYALLNGPAPISRNRTRIKNTQKKILYLLEKIGDKKERHKELISFVERYPLDSQIRVELAYSYLALNQNDKALDEFNKVLEINSQDRDSVFYVVDHHIQNGQYSKAQQLLDLMLNDRSDFDFLNRREAVYRVTDSVVADEICQDILSGSTNEKSYSFVELKARCFDNDGEPEKSISLIQEYLKSNSSNTYAKMSLGYYYIKANDFDFAKKVIQDLETTNHSPNSIKELKREVYLAEINFKKQRAWYFSTYIYLFSEKFNGLSFWDHDIKLLKNFYPFSFGVSYSLQDPFYNSGVIDDLKLHANVEKYDKYYANFYIGNNLKNNKQTNAGLSSFYKYSKSTSFYLDANYRKQVFELNAFVPNQVPTVTNIDLSVSYSANLTNSYNFALGHLTYEIYNGNESHQYARVSLGWDHLFNERFSAGPFIYHLQTLSTAPVIKTLLPDYISIQCLNASYWHKLRDFSSSRALSNRSTGCLGVSTTDSVGSGAYFNYSNITNWYIDEKQDFEFRIELDQSIYQDLNQFFNIYLGYNKWYF